MVKKVLVLLFIVILIASFSVACSRNRENPVPEPEEPVNENSAEDKEGEPVTAEAEIAAWIENSRLMFLAQSREVAGKQYFLVTYGEKDSGGYSVEISGTEVLADRVRVSVAFSVPEPGVVVDTVITYPYAMLSIEATGLPVEFIAAGAEVYIPQLLDIDYLLPIVAKSGGIKLFTPAPQAKVERQFTVEGIANVFEGNFQYKLSDSLGKVVVLGYDTAAMGDWKLFTILIDIDQSIQLSPSLTLELFTESAKDGSVQDQILIPIYLKQ